MRNLSTAFCQLGSGVRVVERSLGERSSTTLNKKTDSLDSWDVRKYVIVRQKDTAAFCLLPACVRVRVGGDQKNSRSFCAPRHFFD